MVLGVPILKHFWVPNNYDMNKNKSRSLLISIYIWFIKLTFEQLFEMKFSVLITKSQ